MTTTLLLLTILALFVGTAMGTLGTSLDGIPSLSLRGSLADAIAHLTGHGDLLLLSAMGVLLSLGLPHLAPIKASLLTALALSPFVYRAYVSIEPAPLVPMEYSLLTIFVLFAFHMLTSWFRETRQRQRLVTVFGQYVPPELVELIGQDPQGFSLAGEAREMTVMFCDVRNFTQIAEPLDPKSLVSLLNGIFDPLTEIAYRHFGTIDKYMGDAVMAFWGAPARDPHHARNAVLAALEMQQALARLRREFRARNWPEIHMGIGINSGMMNVGNMGSRYRVSYTVVGDSVNLAARLESATRVLHAGIAVSVETRNQAPDVLFRELGSIHLKGKKEAVRIFEPLCLSDQATSQQRRDISLHESALSAFYARDWRKATRLFGKLWEQNPEDPLYGLYVDRIGQFSRGLLPDDWAGELDTAAVPLQPDSTAPGTADGSGASQYLQTLRRWTDGF